MGEGPSFSKSPETAEVMVSSLCFTNSAFPLLPPEKKPKVESFELSDDAIGSLDLNVTDLPSINSLWAFFAYCNKKSPLGLPEELQEVNLPEYEFFIQLKRPINLLIE